MKKLFGVYVLVFLLLLPIPATINYQQNDEFIYYQGVQNFLNGNFNLPGYISNTFYTQGLLGATWSLFFGIPKLPVLTLLMSVGSLYLFYLILANFTKLSEKQAFIVSLILMINPLFLYSTFGFMSENYFLFFFLLAFYLYKEYIQTSIWQYFWLGNLAALTNFYVKHFALVGFLAFALYLLWLKKYKAALVQVGVMFLVSVYYLTLFPQSEQMKTTHLVISNLINIYHVVSLVFIILSYYIVLGFPLVFLYLLKLASKSLRIKSIVVISTILLSMFLYFYANPANVTFSYTNWAKQKLSSHPSKMFPYLDNTYTKDGLYTQNLKGTKYELHGSTILANLVSKALYVLVSLVLVLLIFEGKKLITLESAYLICGIGLALILPKVFDRYILPLIPVFILMIVSFTDKLTKRHIYFSLIFYVLFAFVSYQYVLDFHLVNKYVWSRAEELNKLEGVEKSKIEAGHSWIMTYPNDNSKYDYIFEYKGTEKQQPAEKNFVLVEKKRIDFLFSIYQDPYVFLYKRK